MNGTWPMWEVFVRARRGVDHVHFGSVHGADAEGAIMAARDLFTRRQEGVSIWVVPSSSVVASDPGDAAALFDPAADKDYRFAAHYDLPDEVDKM